MRRLPPLTALRAFEAAARHLSFKAAAEELGLTPTAISHQIKALEEFLASPLFRRRPRPVVLTESGATLFPVIRTGFDTFSEAAAKLRAGSTPPTLRVTTTNAFAARWLLPRLPLWRATHPEINTEVIGTDSVLDLRRGNADVAVRYAFAPPVGASVELLRDSFWPVASPKLLQSRSPIRRAADLGEYPFIHAKWPDIEPNAPTWQRWLALVNCTERDLLLNMADRGLTFSEELHAIDAVIAGQGIGLLSDVLVEHELATGELMKLVDAPLPGFGFYLVHRPDHPRRDMIEQFSAWIASAKRHRSVGSKRAPKFVGIRLTASAEDKLRRKGRQA